MKGLRAPTARAYSPRRHGWRDRLPRRKRPRLHSRPPSRSGATSFWWTEIRCSPPPRCPLWRPTDASALRSHGSRPTHARRPHCRRGGRGRGLCAIQQNAGDGDQARLTSIRTSTRISSPPCCGPCSRRRNERRSRDCATRSRRAWSLSWRQRFRSPHRLRTFETSALRWLRPAFQKEVTVAGMRAPDGAIGVITTGTLDVPLLCHMLDRMPTGHLGTGMPSWVRRSGAAAQRHPLARSRQDRDRHAYQFSGARQRSPATA